MRRTILVAEPNDAHFMALAKALAAMHINVERATGPRAVLRMLKGKDAVFLDLADPHMAGGYVLMELAKLAHPPPVVVCVAQSKAKEAIFALRHGCVDWIEKPFTTDQINGALKRVARRLKRESARVRALIEAERKTWEHETEALLAAERKSAATAVALASAAAARDQAQAAEAAEPAGAGPTMDLGLDLIGRVVKHIRQGDAQMPELPGVVNELRQLLTVPDSPPGEVLAVLETDPALCSRIIAQANSPLYGGRGSIRNLREAVTRLGNHTMLEIANTAAVESLFECKWPVFAELFDTYWHSAVATACLARALAREAQLKADDQIYLHALMHNVGELFLVSIFSQAYDSSDGDIPIGRVRAKIGDWHPRVGAELLQTWGLESSFSDVASRHHDARGYARGGGHRTRVMHLINLATRLIESVGASAYPEPVKGPKMTASVEALGISQTVLHSYRQQATTLTASLYG